jgi:hypothetical protein
VLGVGFTPENQTCSARKTGPSAQPRGERMSMRRVVRLLKNGLVSASKGATAKADIRQTHPMPQQPGAIA